LAFNHGAGTSNQPTGPPSLPKPLSVFLLKSLCLLACLACDSFSSSQPIPPVRSSSFPLPLHRQRQQQQPRPTIPGEVQATLITSSSSCLPPYVRSTFDRSPPFTIRENARCLRLLPVAHSSVRYPCLGGGQTQNPKPDERTSCDFCATLRLESHVTQSHKLQLRCRQFPSSSPHDSFPRVLCTIPRLQRIGSVRLGETIIAALLGRRLRTGDLPKKDSKYSTNDPLQSRNSPSLPPSHPVRFDSFPPNLQSVIAGRQQ
jgi:hypothetical protein